MITAIAVAETQSILTLIVVKRAGIAVGVMMKEAHQILIGAPAAAQRKRRIQICVAPAGTVKDLMWTDDRLS